MDTISHPVAMDGFMAVLGEIAAELGSDVIAFYESGFTLPRGGTHPTQGSGWTGRLYLVAAASKVSPTHPTDELMGLPVALDARRNSVLRDLIDAAQERAIITFDELPEFFAASTPWSVGATAAVAVRASFNFDFPSIALVCFRSVKQARVVLEQLASIVAEVRTRADAGALSGTVVRPSRDIGSRLSALRERMRHDATDRRFGFLGELQKQMSDALGEPDIDKQVAAFDSKIGRQIRLLAEHLNCFDIRIYLIGKVEDLETDNAVSPALPELMEPLYQQRWASGSGTEGSRIRKSDGGPIGWVLRNGRRFAVHNLGTVKDQIDLVAGLYPGLQSVESVGIDTDGKAIPILPVKPQTGHQVAFSGSLLIHPIRVGERTIGVIVCYGRLGPPFVFHEWDDDFLGIVALMIGANWLDLQYRQRTEQDRALLVRAAQAINAFSRRVGEWLRDRRVAIEEIYWDALRTADAIAGVTPFSSIKLFNPTTREFRIGPTSGHTWRLKDVAEAKETPFSVEDGDPLLSRTATEFVYRSGTAVVVEVSRAPSYFFNSFPKHFYHAVYVPIFHGGNPDRIVAILDVRNSIDTAYPASISHVLGELAEMLGLVLDLAESRQKIFDNNVKLERAQQHQIEAFQDLEHQIQSPHRNAMHQIERALRTADALTDHATKPSTDHATKLGLVPLLQIARGHIKRSFRVGRSAKLFAELSKMDSIANRGKAIQALDDIQRLLIELVDDQRAVIHPSKGLSISFDPASLIGVYRNDIVGDAELLDQALSNLFDNAEKYSLPNSTIGLQVGRSTHGDRFFIEMTNFGREIERHEVTQIRGRGYRGQAARDGSAPGQGIGLWLVDKIIMSFGGEFEIRRGSSKLAPHRFRLLFARPTTRGG